MLHRTQILLKPKQYQRLKTEAQRQQQSLSAVIRDIIDQWYAEQLDEWPEAIRENDPIWTLSGIIPPAPDVDPATSEHVDSYIYRADWSEDEG